MLQSQRNTNAWDGRQLDFALHLDIRPPSRTPNAFIPPSWIDLDKIPFFPFSNPVIIYSISRDLNFKKIITYMSMGSQWSYIFPHRFSSFRKCVFSSKSYKGQFFNTSKRGFNCIIVLFKNLLFSPSYFHAFPISVILPLRCNLFYPPGFCFWFLHLLHLFCFFLLSKQKSISL